ncbi:MAG: DUF4965 domain-containing protein [Ruminococcaceae bacterium]|nr:DUF4965 domain-containing protein [Oscillospiraceae bacterium]
MNRRLPSYPLITIDPFCSIWLPDEHLARTDTELWCNHMRRLQGYVTIDGFRRRFLGRGRLSGEFMWVADKDISPMVTHFTMASDKVNIHVRFWGPMFMDDMYQLSLPAGFIDYEVESTDGQDHEIEIEFLVHEEFCGETPSERVWEAHGDYGVMYNKNQQPLSSCGDDVESTWGKYYVFGENVETDDNSYYRLVSKHKSKGKVKSYKAYDIFAYDDIYSIEYLGRKLKCLWTEKYKDIFEVADYLRKEHDSLYEKALSWNKRILGDAAKFGEDYQTVVTAAYRQVLAGHKLVRNTDGKILYFSKECMSNGCMNTVDVTFPAVPLFFMYGPELLPGMMNAIYEFNKLPVWKFPFAPHDIGRYPIGGGQLYSCYFEGKGFDVQQNIYKMGPDDKVYIEDGQMPVENSANIIIMMYTYYLFTGDKAYIEEHYETLKLWNKYLMEKGDCKELQLCTDDFAGMFEGNINLAIKAAIGIATFGKLAELMGEDSSLYRADAEAKVKYILEEGMEGDHLKAAFKMENSWSLKYNMIWDRNLKLNLFPDEIYEMENKFYLEKEMPCGTPLNSLRNFTKSDWLMWVASFDKEGDTVKKFSKTMCNVLNVMYERVPFPDFYDAYNGQWLYMLCHRTVQGGVWMPVLADKMREM